MLDAASLALDAIAAAATATRTPAPAHDRAVAAFARLTDAELAARLPGLWMLAWADSALGRFGDALAKLERASATGGGDRARAGADARPRWGPVRPLRELGRLAEAVAAGEEGVDRTRL